MEEKKNQICQKEKFCILQTKNILQQGDLFVINPKDGIVNVERCQENMQKCNLKFSLKISWILVITQHLCNGL